MSLRDCASSWGGQTVLMLPRFPVGCPFLQWGLPQFLRSAPEQRWPVVTYACRLQKIIDLNLTEHVFQMGEWDFSLAGASISRSFTYQNNGAPRSHESYFVSWCVMSILRVQLEGVYVSRTEGGVRRGHSHVLPCVRR